MTPHRWLYTLALALALPAVADEPFPGLQSIQITDYGLTGTIFYDPKISQVIRKPLNQEEADQGAPLVTRVIRTKIDRTKDEEVWIDYDEGPSEDPEIVVTRVGAEESAGYVFGLNFYIPGTGAIYASGHTDTMFDTRRKYVLEGNKLVEVKQPYYWVGLESKTLKDVALLSTKGGKEVVARLPKGSALTVVLSEEDWYLVKTPFGLMGWLKVDVTQQAEVIEGLFFRGD
ncbi:MAG TPA: hypothetical protein VJ725_31220 [Thermoanaerobaculia bacterium]|nr:hypothetical protein [Thermoanaerobaculia bacterium]